MSILSGLEHFKCQLTESMLSNSFLRISLGNYNGQEKELKKIFVRKIIIKGIDMLSFTYRYKTRDLFKNFSIQDGIALIINLIGSDFGICTLLSSEKEIIVEYDKKGLLRNRERNIEIGAQPKLTHDNEKRRLISADEANYLKDLNISDQNGNVFKSAQDKFRQINRYVEILGSLIKELPADQINQVVDMGSGKGYLTFALYDYLHRILNINANVTGVEYREDLVELSNQIAVKSKFGNLNFIRGTIADFNLKRIDLLIALHACDTATDDAIYKGVKAGAKLIVVAPCCHKQIRREIDKTKRKNELDFLLKHGIFLERQAEMITDGIRALILEYFGYRTKIFEFISDKHTAKNILIVGIKSKTTKQKRIEILNKIHDTKSYFGIAHHHLEKLFDSLKS